MIKIFIPLLVVVAILLVCIRAARPKFDALKSIVFLLIGSAVAYGLSFVIAFLMLIFIGLSHIDAYSPAASDFEAFLTRDAQTYFSDIKGKPVTVRYEFLRDGPTQSGSGFPKYYIWVKVLSDGALIDEGAARVAGISQEGFEIREFLGKGLIEDNPKRLDPVFPKPVCETIKRKLGL
ncbi:MAG: hypothetical protein AB9872_07770 [Solidesulfovibrio sp.]